MRPLVAHCHLGLGTLYRHTGDQAKADEQLAIATTMYREMGMGFWLEKAATVIGPPQGNRANRVLSAGLSPGVAHRPNLYTVQNGRPELPE